MAMVTDKASCQSYVEELELDFQQTDSLLNKVKICSYLVCCGASVELGSYGSEERDLRTGNTGLQLFVGTPELRALIPLLHIDSDNPVRIRGDYATGKAVVVYANRELFEVTVRPEIETGNGNINLEFDTLIAAVPDQPYGTRSCWFHEVGRPCAFCILEAKQVDLGPQELVQAYDRVSGATGTEPQVLLTGGTEAAEDRGLSKYWPYLEELRERFPQARVAVEAAPPQVASSLDTLISLGLDTFAANIEFFSRTCRKDLLPWKSAIPLEEYASVFDHCVNADVKTFSAVIAGPEDEEDTLGGVEFLARIGVPTNLLCLRPFPGARAENHARVNPAWFLKVTRKAVGIMDQHGVLEALAQTAGCGSCGACAMEMNLYRLSKNYDNKEFHDSLLLGDSTRC
jgi:hypothetical protein